MRALQWLLGLGVIAGGALGLAWWNRKRLAEHAFARVSAYAADQIADLDLVSALPSPLWSRDGLPTLRVYVRSAKYAHPEIVVAPSEGGIGFAVAIPALALGFEVEGDLRASGKIAVAQIVATGSVVLSEDLSRARAVVDASRIGSVALTLDAKDSLFSGLAGAVVEQFQDEVRGRLEDAIRTAIEEQIPPIVVEYARLYPTAAGAILVASAAGAGRL